MGKLPLFPGLTFDLTLKGSAWYKAIISGQAQYTRGRRLIEIPVPFMPGWVVFVECAGNEDVVVHDIPRKKDNED